MRRLSLVVLVGLVAASVSPARAQDRQVVIPGAPAEAAPVAAAKPAEDHLDLVGPTDAQKARAKAAAEAQQKARLEAEAKAAAEARARSEAEARAKADAERKAREAAEAQARAESERKIREEVARRAEAESKARAQAEAQARAEAEARARAEAEARAKADAESRMRADAEARRKAEIEAQVRAEVERRAREESQARAAAAQQAAEAQARAERAAREEKARAEAEAKARTEAEASLRAEIERRVRAQVEAELRARADKETKARRKAEARAQAEADKKAKLEAKARAKAEAKLRREAKKKGNKPAGVAPLPEVPSAMIAEAPLQLPDPPLAFASDRQPAQAASLRKADPALAEVRLPESKTDQPRVVVPAGSAGAMNASASDRGGTQVAMYTARPTMVAPSPSSSAPASERLVAIPHDEASRPERHAEIRDDVQVGPQSLVANRLSATADLSPGSVAGTFAYRLGLDDSGAMHHTFLLGAGSAALAEGEPDLNVRWFANGSFTPAADNAYAVTRRIGTQTQPMQDRLGWSGYGVAGGLAKSFVRDGSGFEVSADLQLQGLSLGYSKNANLATFEHSDVATKQLRLRGGAGYQSGSFSGLVQVAGYAWLGDGTEKLRGLPLRGVFLEDDLGGLAAAPQAFETRLGGALEISQTVTASVRYTYLGYSNSDWSGAHLFHAEGAARFGRVRAALGFTWQYDAPQVSAPGAGLGDYSTLYLTGTIGYAF